MQQILLHFAHFIHSMDIIKYVKTCNAVAEGLFILPLCCIVLLHYPHCTVIVVSLHCSVAIKIKCILWNA